MSIVIHSDLQSKELKDFILESLADAEYEIEDLSVNSKATNIAEITLEVTKYVQEHEGTKAIVIDKYGIAPFNFANKQKNIIAATVSDEQSAKMTHRHNNTNVIVLGSEVVGKLNALNCVKAFLKAGYDAGRHQIRVDMLNSLC